MMGQASLSFVLRLTAGVLFLSALPARAADETSAIRAKEKAARKACLAGDAATGVALLAELFVDTNDFNYIFNQARCFEQNHRYEDAISHFREYLKKAPGLSADARADAQDHIFECQGLLQPSAPAAKLAPGAPPPGPKPAPEAEAPPPTPAAGSPEAPSNTPSSSPSNSPPIVPATSLAETSPAVAPALPGSGLRVAGIACGAAGLLSIGTAIYFYTRAASLSDKITNSDAPSASDYQSGKSAQTMQWVFYSVGAATLATGSVLYYLGWRRSEPGQTAVAPMVGPGIAGLSAKGAF